MGVSRSVTTGPWWEVGLGDLQVAELGRRAERGGAARRAAETIRKTLLRDGASKHTFVSGSGSDQKNTFGCGRGASVSKGVTFI